MLYAGHHKARLGQRHQLGQAEVHVLLPPGGALDVHHQGIAQRRARPRPQPVGEEQLQVQGPLLPPDVLHVPDIDNLPRWLRSANMVRIPGKMVASPGTAFRYSVIQHSS